MKSVSVETPTTSPRGERTPAASPVAAPAPVASLPTVVADVDDQPPPPSSPPPPLVPADSSSTSSTSSATPAMALADDAKLSKATRAPRLCERCGVKKREFKVNYEGLCGKLCGDCTRELGPLAKVSAARSSAIVASSSPPLATPAPAPAVVDDEPVDVRQVCELCQRVKASRRLPVKHHGSLLRLCVACADASHAPSQQQQQKQSRGPGRPSRDNTPAASAAAVAAAAADQRRAASTSPQPTSPRSWTPATTPTSSSSSASSASSTSADGRPLSRSAGARHGTPARRRYNAQHRLSLPSSALTPEAPSSLSANSQSPRTLPSSPLVTNASGVASRSPALSRSVTTPVLARTPRASSPQVVSPRAVSPPRALSPTRVVPMRATSPAPPPATNTPIARRMSSPAVSSAPLPPPIASLSPASSAPRVRANEAAPTALEQLRQRIAEQERLDEARTAAAVARSVTSPTGNDSRPTSPRALSSPLGSPRPMSLLSSSTATSSSSSASTSTPGARVVVDSHYSFIPIFLMDTTPEVAAAKAAAREFEAIRPLTTVSTTSSSTSTSPASSRGRSGAAIAIVDKSAAETRIVVRMPPAPSTVPPTPSKK